MSVGERKMRAVLWLLDKHDQLYWSDREWVHRLWTHSVNEFLLRRLPARMMW